MCKFICSLFAFATYSIYMTYIKGFNGLRAVSIIFVLLTHLGLYQLLAGHPFLQKNYNLFSGTTGVMIFFTISGFLITLLLLREKKNHGKINLKFFFIRRFLRLLPPLLIFYLAIVLLMLFNFLPHRYLDVLISFFYLYNFVPYNHYMLELGHTWSLSLEEQFYLLWPFIVNRTKTLNTICIFSLCIIACCIIGNILYPLPIYFNGKPHFLTNYFYVERWFIPACLPIMIGSLSGVILFKNEVYLKEKFHKKYMLLLLSLSLFFVQLIIPGLPANYIKIAQPLGIAFLLLWVYNNQNSYLVNFMELKPIAFIGKISYGIYVFQGLFLTTGPGGALTIQHFPLNIILTLLSAIISYFLIEKRVLKYKDKFKLNIPVN